MNKVNLVGRLTKNPELRYFNTNKDIVFVRFSVAINRKIKRDNEKNVDFVNCIAFSSIAKFIDKYFFKGMRIGLSGRIQTGSYKNKDNIIIYTTNVVVEEVEFIESKKIDNNVNNGNDEFMILNDYEDNVLPFNN